MSILIYCNKQLGIKVLHKTQRGMCKAMGVKWYGSVKCSLGVGICRPGHVW